jgi:hypothetical protein
MMSHVHGISKQPGEPHLGEPFPAERDAVVDIHRKQRADSSREPAAKNAVEFVHAIFISTF